MNPKKGKRHAQDQQQAVISRQFLEEKIFGLIHTTERVPTLMMMNNHYCTSFKIPPELALLIAFSLHVIFNMLLLTSAYP